MKSSWQKSTRHLSSRSRVNALARGTSAYSSHSSRAFDAMVFDLDGVLYPADNGYMAHVRRNAREFIRVRYGKSEEEAAAIRLEAFRLANQTVKGLRMLGYEVDAEDFMDFCRSGEDQFLSPDLAVVEAVSSLSARYKSGGVGSANQGRGTRMVLLTNTAEKRARVALECLGLSEHFDAVYGADFMRPACKPEEAAFRKVLEDISVAPSRAVMFEDSFKNLKAAKAVGMTTVFVRGATMGEEGVTAVELEAAADAVVPSIEVAALRDALPSLWG